MGLLLQLRLVIEPSPDAVHFPHRFHGERIHLGRQVHGHQEHMMGADLHQNICRRWRGSCGFLGRGDHVWGDEGDAQ